MLIIAVTSQRLIGYFTNSDNGKEFAFLLNYPSFVSSAIKCIEPPHVENAALSTPNELVYNTVIKYECLVGYIFSSGASHTNSTCRADGTWSAVGNCACKCIKSIPYGWNFC